MFTRVLQARRLHKQRECTAREEQAGFRPERGCCDQIFALRQIVEEHIRCGKRLIIVFIDFRAAFDSVYWPALWNVLESEYILPKIVRLLQETYANCSSFVRIREGASNVFTIRSGVRQGCVLSPLLFNSVVDAIMRKVFSGRQGVQIGEDQFVTDLMFADDSAIFADSDAEANEILQEIAAIALSYGLTINAWFFSTAEQNLMLHGNSQQDW